MADQQDIVDRLRIRADIRRNAVGRKSVEEGKPDRLALLLDEAAEEIDVLRALVRNPRTDQEVNAAMDQVIAEIAAGHHDRARRFATLVAAVRGCSVDHVVALATAA